MDSKEYTITEITEIVGVSKATVYNKILTFQDILRNHINVRKGTKYVDSKGLEIIKNSIGVSKINFNPPEIIDENHLITSDSRLLETLERNIESLETQIEFLKNDNIFLREHLSKEIEAKNKQLEAKDQLLQNFQVLLREQKSFLEAPKKSFFQRIFNR